MTLAFRTGSTSLLLLAACDGPVGIDPAPDSAPGDNGDGDAFLAQQLWASLDGYEAWTRPDGWSATPTESSEHVGLFVVRFDNPALASWDGTGAAPEGSIALKEEYDADGGLLSYTAMQKVGGYDEAHGDWFWAKYDPDGAARASGQVAMCWGCHQDAPLDYLHDQPPAGP